MERLLGLSIIGSSRTSSSAQTFRARNPETGEAIEPAFAAATVADVDEACVLAAKAFAQSRLQGRGPLLVAIADGIEKGSAEIVARARLETGLPEARLQSELARTTNQLRLFARVADERSWVDARIDLGDPGRKPAPKPDVRSMRVPVGPVAVFGASNFPLAFSVAGGDTASALAAGNPVIVKAHPAHPGTSELVGAVISAAVAAAGLPDGTFSLLFDDGVTVGQALVRHPAIAAVGFTGSRRGGDALLRLAAERPNPIPVFAEMGSVNPVVVLPGALRERSTAVAEGFHQSYTQGVGQFCTNPGVVFVPEGPEGDAFVGKIAELTASTPRGTMLTSSIGEAYESGVRHQRALGARALADGKGDSGAGRAALGEVRADQLRAEPRLLEEVFGPSTLVVRYGDIPDLQRTLVGLEGQLSATVHGTAEEIRSLAPLVSVLAERAGRVVFNQFPTGVEVGPAMVHGGPYPATTDPRTTSVGTRAIERFTRLVAFQNAPDEILPPDLRDSNPLHILRLVNGAPTTEAVARIG